MVFSSAQNQSSNKVVSTILFSQILDRIRTKTIINLKLFENYKIKDKNTN